MKRYLLSFCAFIACNFAHAQALLGIDDEFYRTRVKLVDEFIDRFNCNEINPMLDKSCTELEKRNLCMLFDYEYIASNRDVVEPMALAFADSVIAHQTKLRYEDSTWFAKATCAGIFNGKECDFTLYLNVEKRRDDMYKWVISRAEGGIFRLIPSYESEKIMIGPDDHEAKFMSLHRITTQKDDYIRNYKQKSHNIDETSVFYTLVYYGWLDIDYIKDVEFVFTQVPGYVFSIKEIERDNSTNAGWLINSLYQMSDTKKNDILNYLHNISCNAETSTRTTPCFQQDDNEHEDFIKDNQSVLLEDENKE